MNGSDIVKIFLFSLQLGGNMIGNILLVLVLWKSRQLHRSASMNFILNCALVDLTSGMINLPLAMDNIVIETGNLNGKYAPDVVRLLITFLFCLSFVSTLLLMADRLQIVKYPVKYKNIMTVKKARIADVATWVLAFLLATIFNLIRMYISSSSKVSSETSLDYMQQTYKAGGKYGAFGFVSIIFLLVAVLTRKLHQELQKLLKTEFDSTLSHRQKLRSRAKRRAIASSSKTALIVLVIFMVSFFPTLLSATANLIHSPIFDGKNSLRDLAFVIFFFNQMNSCVNPFVFILRSSVLRKVAVKMVSNRSRNVIVPYEGRGNLSNLKIKQNLSQ